MRLSFVLKTSLNPLLSDDAASPPPLLFEHSRLLASLTDSAFSAIRLFQTSLLYRVAAFERRKACMLAN